MGASHQQKVRLHNSLRMRAGRAADAGRDRGPQHPDEPWTTRPPCPRPARGGSGCGATTSSHSALCFGTGTTSHCARAGVGSIRRSRGSPTRVVARGSPQSLARVIERFGVGSPRRKQNVDALGATRSPGERVPDQVSPGDVRAVRERVEVMRPQQRRGAAGEVVVGVETETTVAAPSGELPRSLGGVDREIGEAFDPDAARGGHFDQQGRRAARLRQRGDRGERPHVARGGGCSRVTRHAPRSIHSRARGAVIRGVCRRSRWLVARGRPRAPRRGRGPGDGTARTDRGRARRRPGSRPRRRACTDRPSPGTSTVARSHRARAAGRCRPPRRRRAPPAAARRRAARPRAQPAPRSRRAPSPTRRR